MTSSPTPLHKLYKKLLTFYPREFRERLGESMEQTFNDLYLERQAEHGVVGFMLWAFAETALGIAKERVLLMRQGAAMKNSPASDKTMTWTIQKWGGLASFVLAVTFLVPSFIYLTGSLRDALGAFTYSIADFLYGPVWAVSLVAAVYALRERIGSGAARRMNLALLTALLAAAAMIAIACVRSANRQYHLNHPELSLENNTTVLVVWTTLVAGLTGAGFQFLGWSFVLIGSAGWSTRRLPRLLSVLYLIAGASALLVYLQPEFEGSAILLGVILSIWQGILLVRAEPGETQAPELNTSHPLQA